MIVLDFQPPIQMLWIPLGVHPVLPPNTIFEFDSNFNTSILKREGVYWYYTPTGDDILYRLIVAESSPIEPAITFPDGTLWMDLTTGFETLRIKITNSITGIPDWLPAPGLVVGDGRLHNGTDPLDVTTSTVSAWQPVNLDVVLGDVIYDIEQKLYDNAPDLMMLRYAIDEIRALNPGKYDDYLQEAFKDYVSQSEITNPLVNTNYSPSDPFTWNYKFSTSGTGINLLDADSNTNTFAVVGDLVALFDPCSDSGFCPSTISFFIKNSDGNDGSWNTIQSTLGSPAAVYDGLNDVTIIEVQEPVSDGTTGIMYIGLLASNNNNDGSESGGDWQDYYQKVYGTPFPHLEPWELQGYTDKPDWWDQHYLNDSVGDWGHRRWKYKHGFEIVGIDITDDGFYVSGDFVNIFTNGQTFTLDQTPAGQYDSTFTVAALSNVVGVSTGTAGTATITIPADFTSILTFGTRFATSDTAGNLTGLFTVAQTVFTGPPGFNTIITIEEELLDATGIDNITGLTYNPVQKETKIRVVDDLTVNVFGGRLLKRFGMWEQIRIGRIPPGETYSNGIVSITGDPVVDNLSFGIRTPLVPTYNFFSVNIDNVDVTGGSETYEPDGVFPPYFDPTIHYTTSIPSFDINNRSTFINFSSEIVSPSANFSFGDAGPVEWEWRVSSQFLYDQLTIAYRLDPVRYVDQTFGIDTYDVAGIGIDTTTLTPISHNRITFHGEIVGTELFILNGTGQWYTNFNRYSGYDANYADFRSLWTNWTAPLTYQFATFVDTPSLAVDHRYLEISEFDHTVISKRAPGVEDHWYDVFDVHVTQIPPSVQRYDNQLDWGLTLTTSINQSRDIDYYDVRNYQFYANPTTNVMTIYTWAIVAVDPFNKIFTIGDNQVDLFKPESTFIVSDSTGNDDTYEVLTSTYDRINNTTIIELDVVIPNQIADGTITLNYRQIPWETGDIVYLSTADTLPSPLIAHASGGLVPYYIIVDDTINFRLTSTRENALAGQAYDLISMGRRDHFVGELKATFISNNAVKTDTLWRHYALDKEHTLTMSTPQDIQGMQTLVNIVDGYDAILYDTGWRINKDNKALDPDTGRALGWQVELERFIDYAFGLRSIFLQNVNKYATIVDVGTNVWTFVDAERTWKTGDSVNIFSSNGVYPDPIVQNITYYLIRDTSGSVFKLAASESEAKNGNEIVINSDLGVGNLQVGSVRAKDFSRHQEINPTRNSIWFRPNRGIVSNIIDGPSADIRTSNLIFDQNGSPINSDNLRVFREDKSTKISIIEDLNPEVVLKDTSPYTWLHFGGMHLFLDAYEHVLQFNNRTSEDALIYDPFIGLNVTKFEMLFNRQTEFTERPNMGGYYLHTDFNQGADLDRNIEAGIEDIRMMYDTNTVLETTDITSAGRKGLGYDGTREYLDNLNLHAKSQFLFWRGQIQSKGSLTSVEAFVNSRRFIDAKVDDYWAYKIADFGSSLEKEYPELYITTEDARSNDIRLQFVDESDFCNPGFDTNIYDNEDCGYSFPNGIEPFSLIDSTFTPVTGTDEDRWFHQPDQISVLRDNGLNLYFDLKVNDKDQVYFSALPGNTIVDFGQVTLNGVDRATITVTGVLIIQPGSFVALREVVEDVNTELLVVGATDNGIETVIVLDREPYDTLPTISGLVYEGPAGIPTQNWVLPALNRSKLVYLTWNNRTSDWEFDGLWSGNVYDDDTPILRHDSMSDAVVVTLRLYSEGYTNEYNFDGLASDANYVGNKAIVAVSDANDALIDASAAEIQAQADKVVADADKVIADADKVIADDNVETAETVVTIAQTEVVNATGALEVATLNITVSAAAAAGAEADLVVADQAVIDANADAVVALIADTADAVTAASNGLQITSFRNVSRVVTVADVAGSLFGTYFTFDVFDTSGTEVNYYVWLDATLGAPPAVGTRTAIPVAILFNDSPATISSKIHIEINAIPTLNAVLDVDTIEIENVLVSDAERQHLQ